MMLVNTPQLAYTDPVTLQVTSSAFYTFRENNPVNKIHSSSMFLMDNTYRYF